MPSPVGHALAGVAAGYLTGGVAVGQRESASTRRLTTRKLLSDRRVVVFGLLGVLPDADFLFGVHSMYTHSIGAIVVVALCGALLGPQKRTQVSMAVAAAYGSHVLLDWLGSDAVGPIGIMALWPLTTEFFLSERYWFMSVCREYWLVECWWHNVFGLIRELLILGPVALGAVLLANSLRNRKRPSAETIQPE